jgi:hypothetical protein
MRALSMVVMVVVVVLAIGCKGSKEDDQGRIKQMLARQTYQLKNDVEELETNIKIVEGIGSSDEDKERRGYLCDDLPRQREKLMSKWDAFLWDRISLSSSDDLTWAVDKFPEEGKQLTELGDRLTATYDRMQQVCR